jgi:hypothetical protein
MHTNADLGDYLNQALPNGSPVDPGLAQQATRHAAGTILAKL